MVDNSLIKKCADAITGVDVATADAFDAMAPVILDYANKTLAQREDIEDLIGPNPLRVLYDDHSNHVEFMATQFRLQSGRAVVETAIWVYRSYINRGFSPRYFPIDLTVWMEAIATYFDTEQAAQLHAVYQCLIDSHRDFLVLSHAYPDAITIDDALVEHFNHYLHALLKPDSQEAIRVSREYIQTVWDIPVWWERVICPTMYEIGRLWADGDITIGQEHMATSITQRVMSIYYPMILELPREKGTIVVAVSPGELHEIGARMLADLLEIHGWDVYYTGANTPMESLVELVCEKQAQVLCISTTLASHLGLVHTIIKHVRATALPVHIIVGGQAYMNDTDMWKTIGADGFVVSASKAVSYLEAFSPAIPTNGHASHAAMKEGHG